MTEIYVPDLSRTASQCFDAGARWAAGLHERIRQMRIEVGARGPRLLDDGETANTAVWARTDGGEAFASAHGHTRPELEAIANAAAELANAASAFSDPAIAPVEGGATGSWTAPVTTDPFTGAGRDAIHALLESLVATPALTAVATATQADRWIASTSGADVEQHWSFLAVELSASGRRARRAWSGGAELLDEATTDAVRALADGLTSTAGPPSTLPAEIVIRPDALAVLLHELWLIPASAGLDLAAPAVVTQLTWRGERGLGARAYDDRGLAVESASLDTVALVSPGLEAAPRRALPDLDVSAGSRNEADLVLDALTVALPQRWRVAPDRSALLLDALGALPGEPAFPLRVRIDRGALERIVAAGSVREWVPAPVRAGSVPSAVWAPSVRLGTGFGLL